MSTKNNGGWASSTKAAVNATKPATGLRRVGGMSQPISIFYQYSKVKDSAPPTAQQIPLDQAIEGVYEGTLTTKKYNTTYYKVNTATGLVAIQSSGQLASLMKKVAQGATVQITYTGKQEIAKGKFAGKEAHSFLVNASELIEEEAG